MLANKLTLTCLAFLSLIAIAASTPSLSFTSEAELRGRPEKLPRLLDVDPILQARVTSCGEAAITMAYNFANPDTPMEEQEVIDFAAENDYFTENRWPFTSPVSMVKIARHYADSIRTGRVLSAEQGLSLLAHQLEEGEPIIIDIQTRLYDPDSGAHFVLVTGISIDPERGNALMIHYNDPLTGTKRISRWDGNEGVWRAWQNNGDPRGSGWWLAIPPP
jgi:hypothetical protein